MDPISICFGIFVGLLFIVCQQMGKEEDNKKIIKAEQKAIKRKQQQQNNKVTKCPKCNEYIKTNKVI